MFKDPLEEAVKNFEDKHGGSKSAVLSLCGNYYLYPDGASRDVKPSGIRYELPRFVNYPGNNLDDHTWKILQNRINYYETKKEWAERDFEVLRESMMNTDYSNEQWQKLERLQKAVDDAWDELEEVLNEEKEHPIYKQRQAGKRFEMERQQRIKEKSNQLINKRI